MGRQLARRQRRERIAGVVLALLGAVVLIVAILAIAEPKDSTNNAASQTTRIVTQTPTATPTPSASTPSAAPTPSSQRGSASLSLGGADPSAAADAKKTPIVVLNNTTTSKLAKTAATRFRSAGWTVQSTGNLVDSILSTCAYYDPDVTGAQAAAKELQKEFPTIKRVAKKFSGLPSGPVVVVLTSDYSSD